MKKNIITSFTLVVVFSFGTLFSQTINKPRLDSLFDILAEKNKAMGSVAISKNGTMQYSRAIGYSFISGADKKSSTTSTKYRIGSISKMFTATMIFQLIEEGKIQTSTTLGSYFPNIPNANKITVGNLLNHRSGLHNFTDDSTYGKWMTTTKTEDEMLAMFAQNKADFPPNEKTSYSNTNYVLLGYIIERVTKQPYAKVLSKRIVEKAGLSNTEYGGKTDIKKEESYSYVYLADWQQQPETDMSIPGGAGGIVSTPTDLTKFIEALFSFKLVSENSLNQMKTIKDRMGMGMFQIPFYDRKAYGHNGSIDGFESSLAFFQEDSLSVAYCTNGEVYPLNNIMIDILSICFNREGYSIPTFKTLSLTTEELDKYLGIYSSTQIPLKITITKNNTTLLAQATGQSAFPLEPVKKGSFKFDQAGIVIDFNPDKNEFTLKQGGGTFLFTKE